jgi:hypothetical protein
MIMGAAPTKGHSLSTVVETVIFLPCSIAGIIVEMRCRRSSGSSFGCDADANMALV